MEIPHPRVLCCRILLEQLGWHEMSACLCFLQAEQTVSQDGASVCGIMGLCDLHETCQSLSFFICKVC